MNGLKAAWDFAEARQFQWWRHPESGVRRPTRAMIRLLKPLRTVEFRLWLIWKLLTSPANTAEFIIWENPRLRWKAVLLACGPQMSFKGDKGLDSYRRLENHVDVLLFDGWRDSYGWSSWFVQVPYGWRFGRIYIYQDGDSFL